MPDNACIGLEQEHENHIHANNKSVFLVPHNGIVRFNAEFMQYIVWEYYWQDQQGDIQDQNDPAWQIPYIRKVDNIVAPIYIFT